MIAFGCNGDKCRLLILGVHEHIRKKVRAHILCVLSVKAAEQIPRLRSVAQSNQAEYVGLFSSPVPFFKMIKVSITHYIVYKDQLQRARGKFFISFINKISISFDKLLKYLNKYLRKKRCCYY